VQCPYCRANDDKVVDSRLADEAAAIRRRRECLACGRRFTTYERVEEVAVLVRKRSGESEPFDRAKLRAGIAYAGTGRLDDATIDAVVVAVEEELRGEGGEVASDHSVSPGWTTTVRTCGRRAGEARVPPSAEPARAAVSTMPKPRIAAMSRRRRKTADSVRLDTRGRG